MEGTPRGYREHGPDNSLFKSNKVEDAIGYAVSLLLHDWYICCSNILVEAAWVLTAILSDTLMGDLSVWLWEIIAEYHS